SQPGTRHDVALRSSADDGTATRHLPRRFPSAKHPDGPRHGHRSDRLADRDRGRTRLRRRLHPCDSRVRPVGAARDTTRLSRRPAGVAGYLRRYRGRRPLDGSRMAYYEAMACMRGLVRTAAARLAPVKEHGLTPLDASIFGERLARRFASITGVAAKLPARGI